MTTTHSDAFPSRQGRVLLATERVMGMVRAVAGRESTMDFDTIREAVEEYLEWMYVDAHIDGIKAGHEQARDIYRPRSEG